MPLQQLVEYFNDRFGQEHHASFRPFVLDGQQVSGLFGPIKINTFFTPLRQTQKLSAIKAYAARLHVSTYEIQHLYANDIENLLVSNRSPGKDVDSIVNFDRLCRTVHMLNYLPLTHLQELLFLEVDPRHILGIKQDHGAYFEEVITRCGLATKQVVIVLSVNIPNLAYVPVLVEGLENYRRRGYKIALKFDYVAQDGHIFNLVETLAPNFVSLSTRYLDQLQDSSLLKKLQHIKTVVAESGGLSILQQVDHKKSALLARHASFDWVQGSYYEQTHASALASELDPIQGKVA